MSELEQRVAWVIRDALQRYLVEGTTDSEFGEPPYRAPWFLIDQSTAEPEVDWPGDLVEQFDEPQAAHDHRDRLVAQAALKAHAEWLAEQGLEIVPMNLTGDRLLGTLGRMSAALQQEDSPMTDIRERLLDALNQLVHDETNPARVNAVLAELPLTQVQLDGLASGEMVVVPREAVAPWFDPNEEQP